MINLRSLKDELRSEGLFESCELRTWGKFGFFALCIAGFLYAHTVLPIWGSALLVPVTAWFCACLAMLGHEGSHRAFSTSAFRNQLLFHLAFPVMGGVSAKYWHWKHDVQHHAYPNVVDTDPDILLWPMASTALEYRRSSRGRQWFQRNFQGMAFWPLCFLLVWSMRGSGLAFLYRYARDKGMDRSWWADAGSLGVHALVWIVLPMAFFGVWGLALYASIWTLVGIALSMVFAPAHIGMPIVSDPDDIIRLQFETTRNLVLPFGLSFFFIGLEHQVEHHLFPRISHQHLAKAAVITKAWAERNEVPYHGIGYLKGLIDTSQFIGRSWQYEPDEFVQIQPKAPAASMEVVASA